MTIAAKIETRLSCFVDALTDPVRRGRAMLVLLAAYTATWTIYGVLAKASQDLHADMSEIFQWGREFALGFFKHPPLAPYLTGVWFLVFPDRDWAFYLLAIVIAALALWIAWRVSLRYLDPSKALAATLLLTFIPFFNFHALKFNANTVLLPAWAATIYWFLISYETRSRLYAVLAGVGAGLAMLGKYWSIFLLLGLGLVALIDRRRGEYFRSAAPYLTIIAGAVVLAPHVVWLFQNDFAPLRYATTLHADKPVRDALLSSLGYLGGSLAYVALPLLLIAVLFRPSGTAARDTWLPPPGERRFIALAFWLPFLLPALLAPLGGTILNSLWSMSAWTLFGVVLLSSPKVEVTRPALGRLLGIAIVTPLVAVAVAPAIAYAVHRGGLPPWQSHASRIAPQLDDLWKETTDAPLQLICGDAGLADGVGFYSSSRPRTCQDLAGFAHGTIRRDAAIARRGIAVVCFDDARCNATIDRLGSGVPGAKRRPIEVSRSFMGYEGERARYLIAAIPPEK